MGVIINPFDGSGHSLATLVNIGKVPTGDRLQHKVAQGSRLDGPGDDWPLAGIGGELAQ